MALRPILAGGLPLSRNPEADERFAYAEKMGCAGAVVKQMGKKLSRSHPRRRPRQGWGGVGRDLLPGSEEVASIRRCRYDSPGQNGFFFFTRGQVVRGETHARAPG